MIIEIISDLSGGIGGDGGSNLSGVGSPEGAVSAAVGRGYVQTGSGGAHWVKISGAGNTGWLSIGPGAAYAGPQMYTGSAVPEGLVAAVVGSQYTQIVAGVYTATYHKVSGSGAAGWS